MKRDMDLVRRILLAYEASNEWRVEEELVIEGYRKDEIEYHQHIMRDAGFLQPAKTWLFKGTQMESGTRLTWAGHDFLEASRDEKRWKQAKKIAGKVGVFTLEILKQVLTQLIQTQLKQVME